MTAPGRGAPSLELPQTVEKYTERLLSQRYALFCVQIDEQYTVVDRWGDAGRHGLATLSRGDDLRVHAPYVSGLAGRATTVLPFVHTTDRNAAHVHVLGDRDGSYVIYLDASREQAQRFELQQTANEVRLLNHRQQRLIDQLIEARAELDTRRRQAERANRLKSRFIASMSHEFRTPLTSVMGYAQLLAEARSADGELMDSVAAIERASRHLLSLVDNILDQARLEDGSIEPRARPTRLREIADDLAAILAPLAAEKGIAFAAFVDPSVPDVLLLDDIRGRQILLNLLGNAVKFTDTGSVSLELAWADDQLVARVSDTGPGIRPEDRQRIFDAFHRTTHAAGREGAGLGLNISLRLARILGGDIDLDTAAGKGSTFTVRLPAPVAESAEAPEPADARDAVAGEAPAVLIAEDNVDIVRLIERVVGGAGYRLTVAANGQDALDAILTDAFDLAVLDVNMPVMDGLSVARELRRRGRTLPIVALTASRDDSDRDRALAAGCTSFLTKPIRMPELLRELERLLPR